MEGLLLVFIGFMALNFISWILEPFQRHVTRVNEYRTTNVYTDNSYNVTNTLNVERGMLNGSKEEDASYYAENFGSQRRQENQGSAKRW